MRFTITGELRPIFGAGRATLTWDDGEVTGPPPLLAEVAAVALGLERNGTRVSLPGCANHLPRDWKNPAAFHALAVTHVFVDRPRPAIATPDPAALAGALEGPDLEPNEIA